MAEFSIIPPDEFIKALYKLGDVDKVAPRMLEAGIQTVKKAVQKGARRHIHTGQMVDSITTTKPKKNKNGEWGCAVTLKGKDKKTGVRNAVKFFELEYGNSKQPATPVARPAIAESEKESLKAMQDVFEFETDLKNIKL